MTTVLGGYFTVVIAVTGNQRTEKIRPCFYCTLYSWPSVRLPWLQEHRQQGMLGTVSDRISRRNDPRRNSIQSIELFLFVERRFICRLSQCCHTGLGWDFNGCYMPTRQQYYSTLMPVEFRKRTKHCFFLLRSTWKATFIY